MVSAGGLDVREDDAFVTLGTVPLFMRIAITGPSGSGKTWLSARLAESLRLRHVELDAPPWSELGVLPVPLVMWRLVRRTHLRRKHQIELWHGNREDGWRESLSYVIWPAFKRALENRRRVPERLARHPHLRVHRLRSDRDVDRLVQVLETTPVVSRDSARAG